MQPSTIGDEFCRAPGPALPKPTARSLVTAHRLRRWAWAPGTRHSGHEPQTRAPARVSTGAAGRPEHDHRREGGGSDQRSDAGLAGVEEELTMAEVAKPAVIAPIKPGTSTSFGAIRQVDAGLLNVGYAEAGPADG